MPDTFYLALDDSRFRSTEHTIGPWSKDSQHGSPPSALLGRAIELAPGGEGKQVARITLELLRPVPIEELTVSVEVVRPGKRVDLVQARLDTADATVMMATAWRIRTAAIDVPGAPGPADDLGPDDGYAVEPFPSPTEINYLSSMDLRFTAGSFLEPGPARAWFRMKIPLVDGEEPSPLVRVLIAADTASGISALLDPQKWLFINPDLSVHLHRMPVGEWVCLDATTTPQSTGIGIATSAISDVKGPIGAGGQSLLIEPR